MKLINYFLAISIIILFTQCAGEEGPVDASTYDPPDVDAPTQLTAPVVEGGSFFDNMQWIEGNWVLTNGRNYERWIRTDYGYHILGYKLKGADTLVIERGTLKRGGSGDYYFVISVLNLNAGNPMIFTLESTEPSMLVFTNPENRYPTKLKYFYQDEYTIRTFVEGVIEEDVEVKEGIMKRR